MASSKILLACLTVLAACAGGDERNRRDTALAASAGGAVADSAGTTQPGAKPACPATGQWAMCNVVYSLERAGLAPRLDSNEFHLEPLTVVGRRVAVGSAELDVFLYPTSDAREREESRLDKRKFIEATAQPTLRGEATVIRNVNLLAILRSRNDHQRERVSDALTAGPPQPTPAVPIAGAKAR